MRGVKDGLLTFFFPVARFENRVVLIGSGHPVFPGHCGKLNRLMEICSSRRTHVDLHDISPPPSCIISPRPALLEIPGSAHCSFPSLWTSARPFPRRLSLLSESLNAYMRFIRGNGSSICLKFIKEN